MTLRDLQRSAVEYHAQAKAIYERVQTEDRDLSQEEHDLVDSLLARSEELQERAKTLERYEDQKSRIQELGEHFERMPTPKTLNHHGMGHLASSAGIDPRSYTAMFGPPSPSRWGTDGLEFYAVLQSERFDSRLISAAAMGEASGSTGGFLVPEERAAALLDGALHQEIVRPRADVTPMISKTKVVAGFDGRDQSTGLYGFTFQWLQENQTAVPGTGEVRAIQLTAHPGAIYLSASNELVQDAMDFERQLELRIIVAMAENLDYYYLRGTGAGMPLGVLRSGARLVVAKLSGQPAATVESENLTSMFAKSSNPTGSVWVVSPTALPQLLALTVTPAVSTPMVQQNGDGSMTLLTRPLLVSSKLPVLGQEGDILFADFSAYQIGLRKEVSLEKSRDVGFAANQTWYRCIVRTDGQPKIDQSFIGRDSQEYSPFVVLAVRS